MFDAPVFAAMCSGDFNSAIGRISRFKGLCAPIALHVDAGASATWVVVEWSAPGSGPPPLLYAMELAYCVQLPPQLQKVPPGGSRQERRKGRNR